MLSMFSKAQVAKDAWVTLNKLTPNDTKFPLKIDRDDLAEAFVANVSNKRLKDDQNVSFAYHDTLMNFKINSLGGDSNDACYYISDDTQLSIAVDFALDNVELTGGGLPLGFTLDFKSKGIGGHKKELDELVRKAFYSRAMGKKLSKALDMKHTKGVLLYGPPGTGKTLIAREIANMFMGKVKIVNGPELKDGLVGQSVKNLERVFAEAIEDWAMKGEDSPLHVIIIDEIDALCPTRGSRKGTTGVDDDMVSRLLTLLDGVDSPKNILVIGMTNRRDLIDPAVLRAGRLEVHIEINLPNEQDRLEILNIKTQRLKERELLDDSVDLAYWASETKNYSGAEIEQLVKGAKVFATSAILNYANDTLKVNKKIKDERQLKHFINQEHFASAFLEITPAFGVDKQNFKFNRDQFFCYNKELARTIADYRIALGMLCKNKKMHNINYLISGPRGVGKATLARYLADTSHASSIRIITPERLLGLSLNQQIELIEHEFDIAKHSELGVILLDEVEGLLHANAKLQTYDNELRLKFASLLKNLANSQSKCVVIATTRSKKFMEEVDLAHYFKESKELSNVVIKSLCAKESVETLSSLAKLLGYRALPSKQTTGVDEREINLSIEDLIYQISKYCADERHDNKLDIDGFYNFLNAQKEADCIPKATSGLSLFQSRVG